MDPTFQRETTGSSSRESETQFADLEQVQALENGQIGKITDIVKAHATEPPRSRDEDASEEVDVKESQRKRSLAKKQDVVMLKPVVRTTTQDVPVWQIIAPNTRNIWRK